MSVHGYYDVTNIKMFQCTHVNLVMFRDLYLQGVLKNVFNLFCFMLRTVHSLGRGMCKQYKASLSNMEDDLYCESNSANAHFLK